jgi:hypothetical protein
MLDTLKRLLRPTPKAPPRYDGTHSRNWWTTRDKIGKSSAAAYWGHRNHPSRQAIAAAAVGVRTTGSLLEVGCHAGPTLYAISRAKRFKRMAGTELSSEILEFAKRNLPDAIGQPVELVQASADNLPFEDASFDVVVTCMMLQCIGPEDITASLNELLRVSRRFLILGEPYSADKMDACPEGRADYYPNTTYWIRNYARMLEGKAKVINTIHLPEEDRMGHLDSVLTFEKLP